MGPALPKLCSNPALPREGGCRGHPWLRAGVSCFCGVADIISFCFQVLLWRFVIHFFVELSRCPPPLPALHPLISAPSTFPLLDCTQQDSLDCPYLLFFFFSSLFPPSFVFWYNSVWHFPDSPYSIRPRCLNARTA